MPDRRKVSFYATIIWIGVFAALSIVALTGYWLNDTALSENRRSYSRNLSFLADSTSKSIKLFFERALSEIILFTEIDAIKEYRVKEVDFLFRGFVKKREESVSHMILFGPQGEIRVMLTKDPHSHLIAPQISEFYTSTMEGWTANLTDDLIVGESYEGIGIGMPIFRSQRDENATSSGIYKSGMVMAIIDTQDIAKFLLQPVSRDTDAIAWLVTDKGKIIGDANQLADISISIYGAALGDVSRLVHDFDAFMQGEQVTGWNRYLGARETAVIDFGAGTWRLATTELVFLDKTYTVAVAAPAAAYEKLITDGYRQSMGLFAVVVVILMAGGWLMTQVQRRLTRAEERAIMAVALEEKNRSLRELNRRMDDFVAVVSHDIRSPLHVIIGFVKMIRSHPDGHLFDRETSTMLRSCNRLKQLVDDILDLAKLEAGKVSLAYDPINLDELIAEAVMTMEFSANEKKVALLFDPSEPLPIQGDSSKLSQVFNNLLANAIKFTPAQGKVTVSTVMNDDQTVTINVVDTGPGIPAEARKMVFDKFEQLKTYQKGVEPGSGLGLTICKNIVDLHGGTITVTSAPGDGSTFTVTLPLVRPSNLNDSGVLVLNRITAK